MPVFTLGESRMQGLHGSTVIAANYIEMETPKAVLFVVHRSGEGMETVRKEYWIPKSQINLTKSKIEIKDWFWEKECQSK